MCIRDRLYGVNLIIHVVADKEILDKIYEGFKNTGKAFTLGRGEDLARLDYIKFVQLDESEIEDEEDNSEMLKKCFYVPNIFDTNLQGISYKINKNYKIVNGLRRWNKINVKYVEKGNMITKGKYYVDNDIDNKDIAFLA